MAEDGPRYKAVAARIKRYIENGWYMKVDKKPIVKVKSIEKRSDGTVKVVTLESMDVVRSDGAGRFVQTNGEHIYILRRYADVLKVYDEII